jgi:hypothetical protein
MAKRPRSCPCVEHKNKLAPFSTWKRHTQDITRGTRRRWDPRENSDDAAGADTADEDGDGVLGEIVDEPAVNPTLVHYSTEVLELVARGVVGVTGAEAMLQIQHANYQPHLPEGVDMPKTWYKAKKAGMKGRELLCIPRDFCTGCDSLFPVDKKVVNCPDVCKGNPKTRFDPKGTPLRRAYYFDIAEKIERLYSHRATAEAMAYGFEYEPAEGPMQSRELTDSWDCSILQVKTQNPRYVCHP